MFKRSIALSALFTTLLATCLVSVPAFAGDKCSNLFRNEAAQSIQVRRLVRADAFQQWLIWEQLANLPKFIKPTGTVELPLAELPEADVHLVTTGSTPQSLVKAFFKEVGKVFWAKHPYNQSKAVPHHDAQVVSSIPVYMTSSRSMALTGPLRGFTIKVATDHPHGPNGERQKSKISINDDIDSAMLHTEHLQKVDQQLGADPKLIMIGETMTIADKKTGFGMVVRDVRILDDGNYYLPAFSIPYVGKEIAALNGKSFEDFFGTNYAALLGEAKARLLLRTGLQMLTPNPQNVLLQLDRNLRPTGKIVLRDVSDAYLVDAVAKGLGFSEQIASNTAAGYSPIQEIKPFWSNSSWRFNRDSFLTRSFPKLFKGKSIENSIERETVNTWGKRHNQAYVEHIERELGFNFGLNPDVSPENHLALVYKTLKSELGQQKLREYRERKLLEAASATKQAM